MQPRTNFLISCIIVYLHAEDRSLRNIGLWYHCLLQSQQAHAEGAKDWARASCRDVYILLENLIFVSKMDLSWMLIRDPFKV